MLFAIVIVLLVVVVIHDLTQRQHAILRTLLKSNGLLTTVNGPSCRARAQISGGATVIVRGLRWRRVFRA